MVAYIKGNGRVFYTPTCCHFAFAQHMIACTSPALIFYEDVERQTPGHYIHLERVSSRFLWFSPYQATARDISWRVFVSFWDE